MHDTIPRLVAMSVASDFSYFTNAAADERDAHATLALLIGSHLDERGFAGQWDRIDVPLFARQLLASVPDEASMFFFYWVWMLAFLVEFGDLPVAVVERYYDAIARELPAWRGLLATIADARAVMKSRPAA